MLERWRNGVFLVGSFEATDGACSFGGFEFSRSRSKGSRVMAIIPCTACINSQGKTRLTGGRAVTIIVISIVVRMFHFFFFPTPFALGVIWATGDGVSKIRCDNEFYPRRLPRCLHYCWILRKNNNAFPRNSISSIVNTDIIVLYFECVR